jgi:hypothetical protein
LTRLYFKKIGRLNSPIKIQEFLDSVPYSSEERYRSPQSVLTDNKAHCFDGAVFAAAAFKSIGYPPLIVELIPNDRDDDHILAVYKRNNSWGAVAKSNFTGLRFREPIFRNLRELVMSYFESYFNIEGEKTLTGYTVPLNLHCFDYLQWEINDGVMQIIADALDKIRRYRILSPLMRRKLNRVDARSYRAGLLDSKQSGLFKPEK